MLEPINDIFKGNEANPYSNRLGLVYARVSSEKQEKEGHGREGQEFRCKQDLTSIGVPYLKSFLDTKSGGGDFMNRPAMREMLAFIDATPHTKYVVIFDDLKRFARDTVFHLKLRSALKTRDVLPRCLNYNFDDSPEGMFVETVLAAGNELERHQNRRQVIQKMKARLELGYWPFKAKRGYEFTKDQIHGKISVLRVKESAQIKYALEGFATGIFVRRIDACRYLMEKGFWNGKCAEKYICDFTEMLQDPFYAGCIEYPPWEVTRRKGRHEALITTETFDLNQERLRNEISGKKIRKDTSGEFPLRGLINCASCGRHLTGAITTKGKNRPERYPFYFCQNRACPLYRKSLRKADVERYFYDLLKKQTLKPNVEELVKQVFDQVWKREMASLTDRNSAKKQEIAALKEKINKITSLLIDESSDQLIQIYKKQLHDIGANIERLEREPIEPTDLSVPYRTALDKSVTFLKSPYVVWNKLPVVEQHRLFFFIFEEKLWYDRKEGYRTDKIQSYVGLFEDFATAKSDDVDLVCQMSNRIKNYLSRFWTYYKSSQHFPKMLESASI